MSFPHSSDGVLGQVVIAVDPHKASGTAVAVNSRLQPLDAMRVAVGNVGYWQLRKFARRWPEATWAIEGAAGLGAPVGVPLNVQSEVRLNRLCR